jgi:hypothetical protein
MGIFATHIEDVRLVESKPHVYKFRASADKSVFQNAA